MSLVRSALIIAALVCTGVASALAKSADSAAGLPTVALDSCSWNRPGVNPFMGDVVAAVDRYTDIPADVRARLKARMAKREYDDMVSIRRDSIDGRAGQQYGSTIRDMHFGTHQICRAVTRTAWTAGMKERGLVYCEGGQCILVPTVCRNVSRISRRAVDADHAEAPGADEPVPPSAVAGDPFPDPSPTPLAQDESPSFAKPLGWDAPPVYGGGPSTTGPGEGWGGETPPGGFPGAGGGSIVVTTAVPPGSIDGTPPGGFPAPPPPVPEPQTWALMIGGLAALTFARRWRRVRA
jgi:hypothetical protein